MYFCGYLRRYAGGVVHTAPSQRLSQNKQVGSPGCETSTMRLLAPSGSGGVAEERR